MKRLLVLAGFSVMLMVSHAAKAQVPWPWVITDFPWNTIEGVWQAVGDDDTVYFNLTVVKNGPSKHLLIQEIERVTSNSFHLVNSAPGFEVEGTDTVKALFPTYYVVIGTYENVKDKRAESMTILRQIVGRNPVREITYRMTKIYSRPLKFKDDRQPVRVKN